MNKILIVAARRTEFLYTLMKSNELLTQFGFIEHNSKEAKTGYLVNFSKTLKNDEIYYELYFLNLCEKYRCTVRFYPSFILEAIENENALELLKRQYSKKIHRIEIIEKIDLKVKNHLNLPPKKYLRVYCISETGYNHVIDGIRQSLKRSKMDKIVNIKKVNDKTIITESKEKRDLFDVYKDVLDTQQRHATLESYIIQMHECDIPFDILFACENNIRCGKYYTTRYNEDACHITECENSLPPELSFVAFDIETSKEPLKFPSSDIDQIMMISLVTENSGILIINKNFVKQDVYNFDYHIGSSNKGLGIQIVECNNEELLLLAFLEQIYKIQPIILTTYNGDSFDIPYIKDRMKKYNREYTLDNLIHLDCYKWVKRDSYLPMGSQGLKAVAKIKLGYVPDEVDPEEMVHLAEFESMKMASYSVSDSVATYELYKKYIHPFVYSLCTLIPLPPYDVLSKGSGTLCESLLIAEAINAKILIPPKRIENVYNYEGHICNEVSYVGGHVECLRSGIFRSDFEYTFTLEKKDIDYVKNKYLSMNMNLADTEAKDLIVKQFDSILDSFRSADCITVSCKPLIYHLDVGAMYPNIILTNRLQPMGIVGQNTCVNCDFFLSETNPCQKSMKWKMRVDYLPPKKEEINMLENALMKNNKQYPDLTDEKKKFVLNDQIKQYSKQIYKKTSENVIVDMENIVCQRENPFYVDVVKAFRDKRYILKTKQSELKLKLKNAKESEIAAITKELVIYESLQVAHKCILNSFYGYVMRKNSRWYSMEMAAIVCNEGGRIIKEAKEFIDMIGLTLELDTDGIWCFIPEIMPTQVLNSNFLSFYLNEIIKQKFTNHVYHNKEKDAYAVNSVNEIAFEIDGPYKAMIIPSSTEENKLIKKRYVIINNENKITEVKGFEIKRRGELSIVKRFQEELFKLFYQGDTLSDCYGLIKTHCLYYLNMIETKGQNLTEDDVFTLFSESKSMSKKVSEYENSKSRSINTAKRLAEILGQGILDEKGLKCEFVQSKYPVKSDIAERTLPVQVFKLKDIEKRKYLKKWTGTDLIDLKDLMDWEYYKERLSNIMLRMVVLPSISQGIKDLIPGIKIPDWAMKKTAYGDLTAFAIAKPKTDDVVYANNQEIQSVVKLDNTTKYSKFIKQVRNMWINSIQDCKMIRYLMKGDDHIYYVKNNKVLRKKVRNEDFIYFRCDPKSIDDIENFEKHAVIDQNGYYRIDATHADALYNLYWVTDIVYDNFRNSLDYILANPKHSLSISYGYSKLQIIQHHMILSFQYGSHDYYIHKQADGSIKIVTENREHFGDSAFTCAKITTYIAQKLSKPSIMAIFLSDKNYNTLHRELTKSISLIVPLHDTINASFGGSIKEIIANYRKELESISLEIKSKYKFAEWFKLPLMTYLTFSYNQIYDIFFLRNCKIRLARLSKPVKTSFEDFNKYYYKTCVGYYDSFVIQLKIKDLEFHCLSQNQNSINCEILNEIDRELFTALREMVKEIRTVTYNISKEKSGKIHSKCFTSNFAKWLFSENHYLSETLLQFLQSCVVNYYFGLLSRISEFGAKIIMMNKSVIMIDTKKKSKESCRIFLNNLMSELGTEKQFKCIEMDIVRIMSKLAIADPVNFYFMLEDGTIRSSNQSKVFVKNYLSEFFSGAIENAYFYNLLIKRKYRNIIAINNMLDVYETKQNIDELRSSCCKILNISEFEEKYEKEYLMGITCLRCSTDNMVILTKLQVSNCASCYTSFTEEQVYNAIVSYIMNIIAKRTVICARCSREKSDYLKELCLCGSPYKLSDLPDDLTNLKLYVKNTSHVKNVGKIFSLYVK